MTKSALLSHVIVSQGYLGTFGKYRMQPWVENMNQFLEREGFDVHLFACGDTNLCFVKGRKTFNISRRLTGFHDQFSPIVPALSLIDGKPSIAVVHGLQHLLTLWSIIVYSIRRVPTLIIVHGLYVSNSGILSARDFLIKLVLYVFRRSCKVVALTDYDKKLLVRQWWIPQDRIRITRAFLYVSRDELDEIDRMRRERSTIEKERVPIFLYMGRLDHDQKRVDQIVKVFYRFLKQKTPEAKLILAGEGPLKNTLLQMITRLEIEDHVKLVGSFTEEEKWQYYLSSTALLLMSRFEGMPRVIFEAFAAGRIVVVPDICGLGEVVHNGVNGFLFRVDEDVPELLAAIASKDGQIQAIQDTNRRLTRTVFDPESGLKELKSLIRSVECLRSRRD